jgi:hypothetical protein
MTNKQERRKRKEKKIPDRKGRPMRRKERCMNSNQNASKRDGKKKLNRHARHAPLVNCYALAGGLGPGRVWVLVLVYRVMVDLERQTGLLLVQTLRVDLDGVVYGVVVGLEEVELGEVV